MTRRTLLASGTALALALAAPMAANAQTRPGVLVVGQVAGPRALAPHAVTAVNDFRILLNVHEGLERDASGRLEVEPVHATDWSISDDGTVYTVTLREGVNFMTAPSSTPRPWSSPSSAC